MRARRRTLRGDELTMRWTWLAQASATTIVSDQLRTVWRRMPSKRSGEPDWQGGHDDDESEFGARRGIRRRVPDALSSRAVAQAA